MEFTSQAALQVVQPVHQQLLQMLLPAAKQQFGCKWLRRESAITILRRAQATLSVWAEPPLRSSSTMSSNKVTLESVCRPPVRQSYVTTFFAAIAAPEFTW